MNAYKLRKANTKHMKAVDSVFDNVERMDPQGYGTKLALDSLAVLTTYTGCQAVTNKLLHKINSRIIYNKGNKYDINVEDFTKQYGVQNTKNRTMKENVKVNTKLEEIKGPSVGVMY